MTSGAQQTSGIVTPHEHDVLSGRGNFVNYHAGNEHFRALVRKHKLEYVRCPKPQKGKFSRIIVDEIKNRNPPGRFLKQDAQTKLWYDIGEKKALDKTRQALREGAPDIMKEMTGESGGESDDDDTPLMVPKDAINRRGSAPASFGGDMPLHQFMGSSGLPSPTITQGGLLTSPRLASPGMISPGLLLGQFSPDMGPYSGRASMSRMLDPSALPGPPLQTFDGMNQLNVQQQAMMMNVQLGNNFRNSMSASGMMSPQQIQLQNQINAQQAQMNQLTQQLRQQQQQQQQMNNTTDFAELQMINKLQNMARLNISLDEISQNMYQNVHSAQFDPQRIDHMPPPPSVQMDATRQRSIANPDYQSNLSSSTSLKQQQQLQQLQQQQQQQSKRVDSLPGANPRRMPPPSLMKREDSMKMEKVFGATSPSSTKRKYDANGSSAHLSAMSLSIGDMNEEGNLSSVFDSSLRISGVSTDKSGSDMMHHPAAKEKLKDKSINGNWEQNNLEMSVATIGTGAGSEMRMSDTGVMSYATFGDPGLQDSDGNMSFGKVFEDPDKD